MDNSTLPPEALDNAAAISINIAFLARNQHSLPTLDVVSTLASFFTQNPNATYPEILSFTGARVSDFDYLLDVIGGVDVFRDSILWLNEIKEQLPMVAGTGGVLIPVFWVFTVLTTVVLGLRLWSRQTIAGGVRGYDWIMVVGYFLTLVYGSSALWHATNINRSSQLWDYSWDDIALQQAFYIYLDVLYPITALVIKSSLLLFYYTLSPARYLKWSVYITFGFSLATVLAAVFYSLFKCKPVAYWEEWFTSTCDAHQTVPYLVTGAAMILGDVIIWIMPVRLVMQLKLYRRERVAAFFTFSLGIFACIASVFRLHAVHRYFLTSSGTGKTPIINTWTVIELNLAIICASAPALRALCIKHVPKLLSSDRDSSNNNNSGSSGNNNNINNRIGGRVIVHHDQLRGVDISSLRTGSSGSGWGVGVEKGYSQHSSRAGSPV